MSKTMLALTRLGGAGSEGTSRANALAIIPDIVIKQFQTIINGKFIYVHVDCPEHKQVKSIARKSEKLVQAVVSIQEAS